jgi:hypothetical protein
MSVGNLAITALLSIGVAGCGSTEPLYEAQQQADRAADLLAKDFGKRPQIQANLSNGKLATVNVIFESGQVSQLTVSEIESKVNQAFAGTLKEQPQRVLISVLSAPAKTSAPPAK